MTTERDFNRFKELCQRWNVPFIMEDESKFPTWTGTALNLMAAGDDAWVTHEIAHYLTTKHQDIPNWNLGTDPGGGCETESSLTEKEQNSEENCALVLGVLLLAQTGASALTIKQHVDIYNISGWVYCSKGNEIFDVYNEVKRRYHATPDINTADLMTLLLGEAKEIHAKPTLRVV